MKVMFSALTRLRDLLQFKIKPGQAADLIPRKALLALLVAIILTIIPHIQHLPISVCILGAITLLWALQIYRGVWRFPSLKIKVLMILLFSAVVALSFNDGFSLDGAVALFVVGLLLKPLELYKRSHGLILIFLCYLLVGLSFVYQQGIVLTLYQCLVIIWIIGAQLAINSGSNQSSTKVLKRASIMFLQSLPLILILLFVIPRSGPLRYGAFGGSQGLTGLSDAVTPGDVAQITESDDLVFRVEFEKGQRPAQNTLYWRALVLDQFDGQTWRKSHDDGSIRFAPQSYWYGAEGEGITYNIIQEPTGKNWLFGLRWPVPETENTGRTQDFLLVSRTNLFGKLRYQVTSYPDAKIDQRGLRLWQRKRYLSLPKAENPETQQWVADLQMTHRGNNAVINAMMQYFRKEPFYYSLTPKPLGTKNTIDRFLFDTRTGFCAHYSSALVYALRVAGIPARMVAGYQGGEWNANGQYLTIRQYDAHAWVEAWLAGRGWVLLDPTAMIAPERVEQSLREIREERVNESRFLLAGQIKIQWLQHLQSELEVLNFKWNQWVLSYNSDSRKSVFKVWLDSVYRSDAAKVFAIALLVALLTFFLALRAWHKTQLPARVKRWFAFEAWARRQGYERHLHETSMMFGQRVAKALPCHADNVIDFVTTYTQVEYALNGMADPNTLFALDQSLKRLNRR